MPDLSPARLAEIEKRFEAAISTRKASAAAVFTDLIDLIGEVRRLRAENERLMKERDALANLPR